MPFKSQKQREKFGELVKQGKIKQSVLDEWQAATDSAKLPDRVKPPHKVTKPWRKKK